MKFNVTKIEVEFSKGSFEEFANMYDEQDTEDIIRWETAYNKTVKEAIEKMYPYADVQVGEGYNQLGRTKYYVDCDETDGDDYDRYLPDGYAELAILEDEVKCNVDHIISAVSSNGTFWD